MKNHGNLAPYASVEARHAVVLPPLPGLGQDITIGENAIPGVPAGPYRRLDATWFGWIAAKICQAMSSPAIPDSEIPRIREFYDAVCRLAAKFGIEPTPVKEIPAGYLKPVVWEGEYGGFSGQKL